jgi:hypothetical protein
LLCPNCRKGIFHFSGLFYRCDFCYFEEASKLTTIKPELKKTDYRSELYTTTGMTFTQQAAPKKKVARTIHSNYALKPPLDVEQLKLF